MADNHDIPAYPYMFSADQFKNKYCPFAGQALPRPSQYQGVPTDALGNPIQSYQDAQAAHDAWRPAQAPPVTLNTNPQQQKIFNTTWAPGAGGVNVGATKLNPDFVRPQLSANMTMDDIAAATTAANPTANFSTGMMGGAGGAAGVQQAAGGGQQANPIDMNQAYLSALQNPGPIARPGATVPQAAPPSNQSGVLQQFLANWKNKGAPTQGAGNYNNQGFFNALQGQV